MQILLFHYQKTLGHHILNLAFGKTNMVVLQLMEEMCLVSLELYKFGIVFTLFYKMAAGKKESELQKLKRELHEKDGELQEKDARLEQLEHDYEQLQDRKRKKPQKQKDIIVRMLYEGMHSLDGCSVQSMKCVAVPSSCCSYARSMLDIANMQCCGPL